MAASGYHPPWELAKRRLSKNARKSRSSFYKTALRTVVARKIASKRHAAMTSKAAQTALRTAKEAREAAVDGRRIAKRASIIIEVARRALKKAMSEAGVIRINKAAVIKEARYEYLRREIAP